MIHSGRVIRAYAPLIPLLIGVIACATQGTSTEIAAVMRTGAAATVSPPAVVVTAATPEVSGEAVTQQTASSATPDSTMPDQAATGASAATTTSTPQAPWCGTYDWFFDPAPPVCAEDSAAVSAAAFEPFERGMMVWVKTPGLLGINYLALSNTPGPFPNSKRLTWFADPLTAAQDTSAEVGAPPDGFYAPTLGFGQLWRGDVSGAGSLRESFGWATAPETPYQTTVQCGNNDAGPHRVCYLTLPDGRLIGVFAAGISGMFWSRP